MIRAPGINSVLNVASTLRQFLSRKSALEDLLSGELRQLRLREVPTIRGPPNGHQKVYVSQHGSCYEDTHTDRNPQFMEAARCPRPPCTCSPAGEPMPGRRRRFAGAARRRWPRAWRTGRTCCSWVRLAPARPKQGPTRRLEALSMRVLKHDTMHNGASRQGETPFPEVGSGSLVPCVGMLRGEIIARPLLCCAGSGCGRCRPARLGLQTCPQVPSVCMDI